MVEANQQPLDLSHAASARGARRWWTPAMTVQALVLAGILAFHYWHVLRRLVRIWMDDGDWSHGFLIPFFGLYYLYLQRDRLPTGLRSGGWIPRVAGGLLLTFAFLLYERSTIGRMEYPKNIALVVTIMGVVLMVCGWPVTRWSWFAVAFLIFAMPVPQRLYEQMTLPLREVASQVSAVTLSMVPGMLTEARGTVVEYVYGDRAGTLDIERACAGMRLMMTMSALGVAMAFVNERPLWHRLVMILACIPIAIFCNIIRVTTTGFFVVFDREEWARGFWHTMLGLGMLAIAFGLYGAISHVLSHLFVETEPGEQEEPPAAQGAHA